MYRKFFGYTRWAFIRLEVYDLCHISFVDLYMGPFCKNFCFQRDVPNAAGSKIGRFLYQFYDDARAAEEFAAYWLWENTQPTKPKNSSIIFIAASKNSTDIGEIKTPN